MVGLLGLWRGVRSSGEEVMVGLLGLCALLSAISSIPSLTTAGLYTQN